MTDQPTLHDALAFHAVGDHDQAQAIYEALLERADADACAAIIQQVLASAALAEVQYALGNALKHTGHLAPARQAYERILETHPGHTETALRLGDIFREELEHAAAEDCYRQAIATGGASRYALVALGLVLAAQQRVEAAIECFNNALVLEPDALDAQQNLAAALFSLERFNQARQIYSAILAAHPDHAAAAISILVCAMRACDWSEPRLQQQDISLLHEQPLAPFWTLMLSDSPSEQLFFAKKHAQEKGMDCALQDSRPVITGPNKKIRIGYLSADYHRHATAFLIAELFELHDRDQFEVIGISCGQDDGSAVRQRLIKAFDQFIDISGMDDSMAAFWIETLHIDILVDLKGYTEHTRSALLAHRPAPVTVNYLGYPGTMGSHLVDYILADRIILPFSDQQYYCEKIVHLPECYQVNDSTTEVSSDAGSRAGHGLPERGFVFCCFNGNQKITAPIFASWMRLLAAVEGSVLWLYLSNADTQHNLLRQASQHGLDAGRLVFAPHASHATHLSRYRHADVFLDTTPCNAHTTASDALRMGLPLITVRGTTFAGRVAASLLDAVGAAELIADTLAQYEAIALSLATDPARLLAVRRKIADGVAHGPLFDTARFARHIEAAYKEMYRLALAGEAPRSFAVAAR